MACSICGAPTSDTRSFCAICGCVHEASGCRWDRRPEAAAYEDLAQALSGDETLLAVTRGRITGSWRGRLSLDPRTLVAPYANVGITGERLLLQFVSPSSGHSHSPAASSSPLEAVVSMELSDADPFAAGRSVRLVVQFASGEALRVRAAGRMAEAARALVDVWEGITGGCRTSAGHTEEACAKCGRSLDRVYRFCPYCGEEME